MMKHQTIPLIALALFATATHAADIAPPYARKAVQPVTVKPAGAGKVTLSYHVTPESSYYSAGVDYVQHADVLEVTITRCKVGGACHPMVKSGIPLDDRWEAQVTLPYTGGKIIVAYADGSTQVYP